MRALWSAAAGEPFAAYLVMGIVVKVVALAAVVRLVERRLLRQA